MILMHVYPTKKYRPNYILIFTMLVYNHLMNENRTNFNTKITPRGGSKVLYVLSQFWMLLKILSLNIETRILNKVRFFW